MRTTIAVRSGCGATRAPDRRMPACLPTSPRTPFSRMAGPATSASRPTARAGSSRSRRAARATRPNRCVAPSLPGMPNLHSHAFQRAMAGLTERAGATTAGADSFWTWRELMYAFLDRLTPDHAHAVARAALRRDAQGTATRRWRSSTTSIAGRTARPTRRRTRWRSRISPRRATPASRSRCCRRSTATRASASSRSAARQRRFAATADEARRDDRRAQAPRDARCPHRRRAALAARGERGAAARS